MVKRIIILLFVFSSMLSFGQANRFAGFGQRSTCPVEALKFIDSSGITNQTEKDAICTLVKQLKDSSLWSLFYVIYPMLGGTSSTTKWNLKDVRNTDAAYRITWTGGLTFASTGVKGNGINGVGDTHFAQSSFSTSDAHTSVWNRTDISNNNYIMGNGLDISWIANPFRSDIGTYAFIGNRNTLNTNFVKTSGFAVGYAFFCRTSSTSVFVTRNGVSAVYLNTSTGSYSGNFGICSLMNTTYYASKEVSFCTIGTKFTTAQATTLYNIVQAFQTALGR